MAYLMAKHGILSETGKGWTKGTQEYWQELIKTLNMTCENGFQGMIRWTKE